MKRFRLTSATSIVLVMLCIMYFITYLDRVNVSTAAAGFGKEFNLTHTQVGLVFSAFAYPYLLFQVIGGWVSDRFGARRTLLFCGAIWGLATVFTGLAGGLASLLAARLVLGFGEGATFPAATSAMSRWVAKEKRGFAQGITHAASRVGNAVAPALIVLVMTTWGWRESFYICGALSLVWVALWAITFTEHPKDHPRITPEELAVLPAVKPKVTGLPWGKLFRRMTPVTIVYFCYGWTLWLFLSWIPLYFLHNHHLQLQKSAIFASVVFFAGVIGDTLGGLVTDAIFKRTGSLKRARSWMVSVCMLFCLLSLIPLMFTHDLTLSIACLASGFFFAEMTIGPMWAIPMDIAPEFSGTASGMMNTGSALAAIISPVMGGFLIDHFGNWDLPFVGSMLLMGIGVVLAFRMQPESRFELSASEKAQVSTRLGA
ncbi:MFS transporter [Paraburkholderia youngii]|uniref:MFS family permease n=1 Tax=Paraburkholderia youngii TaxID=2782701 RepID=A0A7W8L4P7_9BURK|nr:MFS transporter [Paraburkholderia youngii]MBB5398964.1 MFS family permease [Paraburkholderia youngii]NVI03963.1 MFS transporter [Paraburkholderia youngii]